MTAWRAAFRNWWSGRVDAEAYRILECVAKILRALPLQQVLAFADIVGGMVWCLDRRGRRVGRQNLDVVFGGGRTPREKQDILRASFRNSVRSVLLLLHISPLTRKRYLERVEVPVEVEAQFRASLAASSCYVLVSGHVGNWELLLGLNSVFSGFPDLVFLAERLSFPALERFVDGLRGAGGARTAMRHGGARALNTHVAKGGVAALLVDRNVRREEGGIWAPFLGLVSCTTPLPGWLAVRNGACVLPILCLPKEDGRYRIWVGPDVAEGAGTDDEAAAILEITTRLNRVLEDVIRARPEIWNWTLKRFKSRPHRELGPYPSYSRWDQTGRSRARS